MIRPQIGIALQRWQSAAEFQKALDVLAKRQGWPMGVEALKPLLGG